MANNYRYKNLLEYGIPHPIYKYKVVNMEEKKNKNMPDYDVVVNSGTKEKAFWHKLGSAWKKEKGISISLNSLPLTNSIMLFEHKER